ncbi:MAG: hypothetical protein IAI49_03500 [Candidatus Eremiobacteraeota bacterium]|nr:hypothetical protein [Candidatus Eremiobacteraeota bacterium]
MSRQIQLRASKLGDVVAEGADTIRDIGQELQKRRESSATQSLTDTLAGSTDRLANYLRTTDADVLLSDVTSYGRSQPALASGIAVLCGFAAARVLKVTAIGGTRSSAP